MISLRLNENKVTPQTLFFCDGKFRIGNYTLHDYSRIAHGWITVETALAKSCNDAASTLVYEKLTKQKLIEYAEKFGFNQKIELIESSDVRRRQIYLKESYIRQASGINEGEFAQLAVGQGPIMLTPLHAAWIASIIANDGMSIQPFLIKKKIGASGEVIKEYKSPNVKRVIRSTTAQSLAQMMRSAVREGTARRVALENVQIAGKTGTTQTASDKNHAWFIAFTDKISIAVVLENVDATGGEVSAPIAKTLILESLGGKKEIPLTK